VPTATKTTAEMSPLSALAGIGSGALGMFTPGVGGTTPWQNIKNTFGTEAFTGTVFDPLQGNTGTYGEGITGFQNQLDDIYGTNPTYDLSRD
jgi:hypothetical protein